jgi:hypothetical protein
MEGVEGKGGSRRKGGEMSQILYAHMNKRNNKKINPKLEKKLTLRFFQSLPRN